MNGTEQPLAVRPAVAAQLLGCSRNHFDRAIKPYLRVVRTGRLVLVPVIELEKWLAQEASSVLARN
jgi:excisionase family DNA binding protein